MFCSEGCLLVLPQSQEHDRKFEDLWEDSKLNEWLLENNLKGIQTIFRNAMKVEETEFCTVLLQIEMFFQR